LLAATFEHYAAAIIATYYFYYDTTIIIFFFTMSRLLFFIIEKLFKFFHLRHSAPVIFHFFPGNAGIRVQL
jgi:hypothetical protein